MPRNLSHFRGSVYYLFVCLLTVSYDRRIPPVEKKGQGKGRKSTGKIAKRMVIREKRATSNDREVLKLKL